jgi:hypothetical protein
MIKLDFATEKERERRRVTQGEENSNLFPFFALSSREEEEDEEETSTT